MADDGHYWMQDLKLHKGAFTRQARERGMTPAEFERTVLAHPKAYDTLTRRRANLSRVFRRSKHHRSQAGAVAQ
jgi:hypothetical protein